MLVNSARSLQALSLPTRISHVTNQKQKLHNDVIEFLERRQLKCKQSDVAGVGNSFLKCLIHCGSWMVITMFYAKEITKFLND
jgi:hypothetical protein